jgi:hypothetical protein
MGEMRNTRRFHWDYLKGRDHLEDVKSGRGIILKRVLKKCGYRICSGIT